MTVKARNRTLTIDVPVVREPEPEPLEGQFLYYSWVDVGANFLKMEVFDPVGETLCVCEPTPDAESAMAAVRDWIRAEIPEWAEYELREIGGGDTGWDTDGLMDS